MLLGSAAPLGFAETVTNGTLASYYKITSQDMGTLDGKTIGYGAGDMFGYKITNMGDLDGNGADDFATIAFGATNNGTSELGNGELLGNSYLTLLNADGTVNASHELSNCAAADETRETRTFGESIDYLGEINGNPTLLISDYWFSKIHILTINSTDYSHTCSNISVGGLAALGWPFVVAGTLEVDNNADIIPDLIAGVDNAGGTGTDLYVMDLDLDAGLDVTVTEQQINDSLILFSDPAWVKRYFENSVVADIDGDDTTIDLVLGEPRAFIGNDTRTDYNGAMHVAFIDKSSFLIEKVTTIEFTDLGVDINRATGSHFAIGLANMGDLDNDGVDDMAVGLEGASIGKTNSGAVTIMFLNADGSIKGISMISNENAPYPLAKDDLFGKGLESIDVDSDGFPELVASAHQDNTGGTKAGAVYVLTFNQDDDSLTGLSYDMTPTPIVLNPAFDNYYTQILSFANYAYADESTPMFGVAPLPFTSTVTQVDDVLTLTT